MPEKAEVHEEYKCPICTISKSFAGNRDFFHCDVHKQPICGNCAIRLADLTEKNIEPASFFYELSKKITGLDFTEFKKKVFRSTIREYKQRLNAAEEEREKMINEQRRFTWQTREEIIDGWKNTINVYSSLLKELEKQ